MASLTDALKEHVNGNMVFWLNHHDLKVLNGQLTDVRDDHVVMRSGDQTYYIPYSGIVAVRSA